MKLCDLLDYVWVLQIFQKWNFTDCSTWYAIIFFLQSNFLNCHIFQSLKVLGLVYHTICSFSKLFKFFIFVEPWFSWSGYVLGWATASYLFLHYLNSSSVQIIRLFFKNLKILLYLNKRMKNNIEITTLHIKINKIL